MRRPIITRAAASALMLVSFALGSAGVVDAAGDRGPDATLYELTENMLFDQRTHVRTATAALQGTARAGSPLCPQVLLDQLLAAGLLRQQPARCTITALGSDAVDVSTGAGTLEGGFAVVVNLDNPVDAAELVVMTGSFTGAMQALVDARFQPLPLIQITGGVLTPEHVLGYPAAAFGIGPVPFGGVFRLP
ncbi:MAG TPA: hypothetical protein VFX28_25235, partial [Methylomirabilota bacterium]|nr:hypothetical protein [Methylomirabilota bacterium]